MKLIYTLLLIVLFCISENAVAQRLRNNFGAGIEIVNSSIYLISKDGLDTEAYVRFSYGQKRSIVFYTGYTNLNLTWLANTDNININGFFFKPSLQFNTDGFKYCTGKFGFIGIAPLISKYSQDITIPTGSDFWKQKTVNQKDDYFKFGLELESGLESSITSKLGIRVAGRFGHLVNKKSDTGFIGLKMPGSGYLIYNKPYWFSFNVSLTYKMCYNTGVLSPKRLM